MTVLRVLVTVLRVLVTVLRVLVTIKDVEGMDARVKGTACFRNQSPPPNPPNEPVYPLSVRRTSPPPHPTYDTALFLVFRAVLFKHLYGVDMPGAHTALGDVHGLESVLSAPGISERYSIDQ